MVKNLLLVEGRHDTTSRELRISWCSISFWTSILVGQTLPTKKGVRKGPTGGPSITPYPEHPLLSGYDVDPLQKRRYLLWKTDRLSQTYELKKAGVWCRGFVDPGFMLTHVSKHVGVLFQPGLGSRPFLEGNPPCSGTGVR